MHNNKDIHSDYAGSRTVVQRKKILGAIGVVAVSAILSGCSTTAESPPRSATVKVTDQELEIRGFIDESTIAQVRALNSNYDVSRIRVDVEGGDPLATMQLGYFIHRRELDLVVDTLCLGACANYLFTAAKTKYLSPESVVAWSGGALSSSWTQQNQRYLVPGARFVAEQYMDTFLRRENRYFERIGVDQAVTQYGYEEASGCSDASRGFYYSIPELLRFGIADIQIARGNWQTAFDHYPNTYCQVNLSREIDVISQ